MGRPAKPTALHVVNGNPGKRALNDREPEPDLLQDLTPPPHLAAPVAAVWNQLAPQLRKAQILTAIDTPALEIACDAIAVFRLSMENTADGKVLVKNAETGNVSLSPWEMVKSMSAKRALAVLREFGATPAARSKVMVDPQADMFSNKQANGPDRFFK